MKFFIPRIKVSGYEAAHQQYLEALKDQFRLPIVDRRIYRLRYVNSKKRLHIQVGELEENENRYEVTAIFESKFFMVVTHSRTGASGPIILVDKTEVTEVEDFDGVVASV